MATLSWDQRARESWDVPIVKLNKDELVVDLGGGHLVNLVGLIDKIKIRNIISSSQQTFNEMKVLIDQTGEQANGFIRDTITEKSLKCKIPFTSTILGGRHTKEHRPRRSRRATRLTRRRRV
jgi:hypothetical protein